MTMGTKSTMADQCLIAQMHRGGEPDPIMPHRNMSTAELDVAYPAMVAPPAVDAEDPFNSEDDVLLKEGVRLAGEIWQAALVQGRKRRMETTTPTASLTSTSTQFVPVSTLVTTASSLATRTSPVRLPKS